MLDKRKLYCAYVVLMIIFTGIISWNLGYNAKHTPIYLYVNYENTKNNLSKAMDKVGIIHSDQQFEDLMKILKEKKR